METFWANQTNQDALVGLFTVGFVLLGAVVDTSLVVEVPEVFFLVADDTRRALTQVLLLTSSTRSLTIEALGVFDLLELDSIATFAFSLARVVQV